MLKVDRSADQVRTGLASASRVGPAAVATQGPVAAFDPIPAPVSKAPVNDFLGIHWPGPGCADEVGWIQKTGPKTTDVTDRFEQLDEKAKAGKDILPRSASDCVYLFVGGLFTGAVPQFAYLGPNMDGLASHGLTVRRCPVDTDTSIEHNAQIVRDAIREASADGKQVVLIGHSKGGLDSEAALSMYPELRSHVRALITIQSPYGGSPIAQDLLADPKLTDLFGTILKDVFHGDIRSGTDLTYDARKAFLAKHPMPPGIPTVCLGSSRLSALSPLFTSAAYLKERYGLDSDGLVSPADAFIPGSKTVTLQGLDHNDATVGTNPFAPYHPGDLTQALVALALEG